MEPNKFEEHIRTKLQERELQPSGGAWGNLEAQLGESKRTNKTLWYAIAASLVAILVVGSFLLKNTSMPSNQIVVEELPEVNSPKNIEPLISEEKIDNTTLVEETITISEENKKEQITPTLNANVATTQKPSNRTQSKKEETQLKVQNTAVTTLEAIKINEPIRINKDANKDFIDIKVDEVVAKVQQLNNETNAVSAEVIESLLEKAQRDIATKRILNSATTKVDPASLLNDVETELERSFRDKVFDALGEGFNKVRTAVGERNN